MIVIEREKRIQQAINETIHLLEKANIKHANSIICLEMEITENRELNNPDLCNDHARLHTNNCLARCQELEKHLEKLYNM